MLFIYLIVYKTYIYVEYYIYKVLLKSIKHVCVKLNQTITKKRNFYYEVKKFFSFYKHKIVF